MVMLLRLARFRGWEAVGVEPSPGLHRIATEHLGLEVHYFFVEDVSQSEHWSSEVVALSDVFEQVAEPRPFLDIVRRLLRPGGLLYIKVPNARWSILKQRVPQLLGRTPSPIRGPHMNTWCTTHGAHASCDARNRRDGAALRIRCAPGADSCLARIRGPELPISVTLGTRL